MRRHTVGEDNKQNDLHVYICSLEVEEALYTTTTTTHYCIDFRIFYKKRNGINKELLLPLGTTKQDVSIMINPFFCARRCFYINWEKRNRPKSVLRSATALGVLFRETFLIKDIVWPERERCDGRRKIRVA